MTDIIFDRPESYLVTGFFTPDYRTLAERFSANLADRGIPHHLYAVDKAEWQRAILMKPAILREAMWDHPRRRIVLMDVDCNVQGDIGPWIDSLTADVTLPARIRVQGRGRHGKTLFSSRVLAVIPSERTSALIRAWELRCNAARKPIIGRLCDERELVGAIGSVHGASIAFTPDKFAGVDVRNAADDAVITHSSEHARRFDGAFTAIGKCGQALVDVVRGKRALLRTSKPQLRPRVETKTGAHAHGTQ